MYTRRQTLATLLAARLASAAPAATVRFHFRSHFWINLHHFVRAEARRRLHGSPARLPSLHPAILDHYTPYANANLVFDPALIRLKDALAAGVPPSPTLQQAAEPYRAALWPAQDRENRAWIATIEPLIQPAAPRCLKQLEAQRPLRRGPKTNRNP